MAINGIIGIIGGVVNVEVGKTAQLAPAIVYDHTLNYEAPPSAFFYESSNTANVTVGAGTGVVNGVTVNTTAQITITYTDETGKTYMDIMLNQNGDIASNSDDMVVEIDEILAD